MAHGPEVTDPSQARMGRPPRISRAAIAQAANEIGLDGLTLRAVASHLGVSIAALYHHVSSKEELLRLAAEASARKVPIPQDVGQHWALWLYEWAWYNRSAFVAEPGLLAQYMDGAITAEAIAENVDALLALLVREGFSIPQAQAAFELVGAYSIGNAVAVLRQRQIQLTGRNSPADLLASLGPGELPHYRELVRRTQAVDDAETFHTQLVSVLGGVAAEIGADWRSIRGLLEEAHGSPAPPRRRLRRRSGAA